jgi:hypothetical protein
MQHLGHVLNMPRIVLCLDKIFWTVKNWVFGWQLLAHGSVKSSCVLCSLLGCAAPLPTHPVWFGSVPLFSVGSDSLSPPHTKDTTKT